jgi:hypothetical protein
MGRIKHCLNSHANSIRPWAYGKEKIRGAERNLPDFFGLCEKLSKIVVDRGGGSDYEKFLLDIIFPTKLTEFPTKLTEFVPFIFIISQYCPTVKRILPDWLCLPNNWGAAAPAAPSAPPPGTPMNKADYHHRYLYHTGSQNSRYFVEHYLYQSATSPME